MKAVSVIVPVYNVEKYLTKCLDSLVNQTLDNLEIICVNDCSPDRSQDILDDYKERYPEKITLIELSENKKQGGARNAGLDVAAGEYIGFVDSDDWVSHDLFELLYEKGKKVKYDVVNCNYYESDGSKILKEQIPIGEKPTRIDLFQNIGPIWSKIYKREIFDTKYIGLRFPENILYEDNYLHPFLVLNTETLGQINKPLYYYRRQDDSTTSRKNSRNHLDRLTSAEMMIDDLRKRDDYSLYKDVLEWRFFEIYKLNSYFQFSELFDDFPYEVIGRINRKLNELDITIKKNPFYKNVSLFRKIRLWFMDHFSHFYIPIEKTMFALLNRSHKG